MAGTTISRHVGELVPLTIEHYMTWQGNQRQDDMFMKLSMPIASSKCAWITSKTHGKTELNVNRLTATLFSKLRARLQQATAGYKCNQGHVWIDHDMYEKTSLVNISILCIE